MKSKLGVKKTEAIKKGICAGLDKYLQENHQTLSVIARRSIARETNKVLQE